MTLRLPARHPARLLGGLICSLSTAVAQAGVYRCVDSSGLATYSDVPCAAAAPAPNSIPAPAPGQPPQAPGAPDRTRLPAPPLTPREAKARQILVTLRLNPDPGANADARQHILDRIAPDLARSLDPDNGAWSPQNGRWHDALEFIKSDLRSDLGPALRAANERIAAVAAREYASRAQDADLEAMDAYLGSAEGGGYIEFQSVVRSIARQALKELLDQEAAAGDPPADAVLRQRQVLLSLGLDARFAAAGAAPADATSPGSAAVLNYAARHEGTALDALYVEYRSLVPRFAAFSDSPTAQRFFAAAAPADRAVARILDDTVDGFARAESVKYAQRWRAYYGPSLRNAHTTVVQSRYGATAVIVPAADTFNARVQSAESMALQCERRAGAGYDARNRLADPNSRAAALKDIQDRCRTEQNLAPY